MYVEEGVPGWRPFFMDGVYVFSDLRGAGLLWWLRVLSWELVLVYR
jgi:hypothetical protein